MNNKAIGTAFEREMCKLLAKSGWWVHFIAPDARGAQPFDIIAVKDKKAIAIDCKTCASNTFNISRLEDNQIMAFELWLKCGNEMPVVAILHKGEFFFVPYIDIKLKKSIKIIDYRGTEL